MKKQNKPKFSITNWDIIQIETMAGSGMTLNNIALLLDIPANTIEAWIDDPEIRLFYEKGRVEAENQIAQTLFEKAKDGDLGAIAWWETTRRKRIDQAGKQ